MLSMNYFDSNMSNITNTVILFDEKGGNLYLRLGGNVAYNFMRRSLTILYFNLSNSKIITR
jgi:hypothetical protein